ncbi:hypothetical protein Plhal304r1_c010g0038671 [Plasmopara halstedii]
MCPLRKSGSYKIVRPLIGMYYTVLWLHVNKKPLRSRIARMLDNTILFRLIRYQYTNYESLWSRNWRLCRN